PDSGFQRSKGRETKVKGPTTEAIHYQPPTTSHQPPTTNHPSSPATNHQPPFSKEGAHDGSPVRGRSGQVVSEGQAVGAGAPRRGRGGRARGVPGGGGGERVGQEHAVARARPTRRARRGRGPARRRADRPPARPPPRPAAEPDVRVRLPVLPPAPRADGA